MLYCCCLMSSQSMRTNQSNFNSGSRTRARLPEMRANLSVQFFYFHRVFFGGGLAKVIGWHLTFGVDTPAKKNLDPSLNLFIYCCAERGHKCYDASNWLDLVLVLFCIVFCRTRAVEYMWPEHCISLLEFSYVPLSFLI